MVTEFMAHINKYRTILYILIVGWFSLFLYSCATVKTTVFVPEPECTKGKNIIVRWGTIYNKKDTVKRYEINSKGEVYKQMGKIHSETLQNKKIGNVDPNKYCEILQELRFAVLKTQALNAPGDQQNFIEYINPGEDLMWRGAWNSKYQAAGSAYVRSVFEQLDSLNFLLVRILQETD